LKRTLTLIVGALVLLFVLQPVSGTFNGLSDVPLPGGPDLADDPIQVTVLTEDVLSLARQASVKVDDVTVGRVDSIERVGWHAKVDLSVRNDVRLPKNAIAIIRQTGLLGEKFVELAAPHNEPSEGELTDGTTISVDRSSRSFEVEEVLGSLSLLLNDGGLQRLQTVTAELHQAVDGRESDVRALLTRLNTLTATLDDNRDSILSAIDGLDSLSSAAAKGTRTIARTIDTMAPALNVLAGQRQQLRQLLVAVTRLSVSGRRTVGLVKDDLVTNLKSLRPVLERLAAVAEDLPEAIPYLLTYPFPDRAMRAFKGDYVNLDAAIRIDLGALLEPFLVQEGPNGSGPTTPTPGTTPQAPQGLPGLPNLPGLPGVPALPELPSAVDLGPLGSLLGLRTRSSS